MTSRQTWGNSPSQLSPPHIRLVVDLIGLGTSLTPLPHPGTLSPKEYLMLAPIMHSKSKSLELEDLLDAVQEILVSACSLLLCTRLSKHWVWLWQGKLKLNMITPFVVWQIAGHFYTSILKRKKSVDGQRILATVQNTPIYGYYPTHLGKNFYQFLSWQHRYYFFQVQFNLNYDCPQFKCTYINVRGFAHLLSAGNKNQLD